MRFLLCVYLIVLQPGCSGLGLAMNIHDAATGGPDSWERESSVRTFSSDKYDIECIQKEIVKGDKRNAKGELALICKKKSTGDILFQKDDLFADKILFLGDDGRTIVGLANVKLYYLSFWIFDVSGRSKAWAWHDSDMYKYCKFSKQFAGTWYNKEKTISEVQYLENGEIQDIVINGCSGDKISLKNSATKWFFGAH